MPGSGKSVAASVLKELGVRVISMGDVVRQNYEKYKRPNESILEFALRIRKERGKGVVAELVLETIRNESNKEEKVIAIEGVRCMEEVNIFKKYFNNVIIVSIHAPPRIRYMRIMNRFREDDPKVLEEIIARDNKELELGIGNVIAMSDYIIINDKDLESFKRSCRELFEMIIYDKSDSKG